MRRRGFAFGNAFELAVGQSPVAAQYRDRLGFVLTITGDLDVLLGVHDPVIVPR